MNQKHTAIYLKILLFFAFICLLGWSIFLIREKLLSNAKDMGIHLAQSYADEEENRIDIYSMLLSLGAASLQEGIDQVETDEQLHTRLSDYSSQLEQLLHTSIIDPYGVINGKIVAAVPWEGDKDYDYASAEWYRKAVEAEGDVVYTNAYPDAITGESMVTLSKALSRTGDVLAFDIMLDSFHVHQNKASLPLKSSYYLFDVNNNLMYASGDSSLDSEKNNVYLARLASYIRQGNLTESSTTITGIDGTRQCVYYSEMSNGWLSVITIPISIILQDGWDNTILLITFFCLILTVTTGIILIRGYFNDKKMRQISETIQILGDSYYAIYRVNYNDDTYFTVKTSPDIRELVGNTGSYQHLLDVVKVVVNETTHERLEENFSAQNIRKLISEGIYDFGGDYQRNFNGVFKWVNIQILYNKALHLDEVILAFREIDAAKRRELQQHALLESALAAAKQTVQQKNIFFSSASHDMRTPLNAIIGLSKLAQKPDALRETIDTYMKKIQQSGEQLLALVNDVLDLSRLEHGKGGALNYAPMNILQCVQDNVDTFREQAEQEHKLLTEDCQVNYSNVLCDFTRLNQILNNLISNALKYSEPGDSIHVSLQELNHQPGHSKYQISVSDTGIGMTEEFQSHLFEPFSREATFTSQKVTGTGLGMPIVKTLVQQMSGEITVRSTLGKGSTFTVTIPLQIADEEISPKNVAVQNQSSFSLKGKTILLAEDNEINMEVASECLSMIGANVLQAWNGQEAVELFSSKENGEIDAILMDMQMPVMDGCSAAKAIRSLRRTDAQTVPIIAVTANVFAEDIAKTTEAGMNAHISKPIDFRQLQQVLEDCLK